MFWYQFLNLKFAQKVFISGKGLCHCINPNLLQRSLLVKTAISEARDARTSNVIIGAECSLSLFSFKN